MNAEGYFTKKLKEWVEEGKEKELKKLSIYLGEIFKFFQTVTRPRNTLMIRFVHDKFEGLGRIYANFKNHSKVFAGYGDKGVPLSVFKQAQI